MASSIAGVFWRAVRHSELAHRHTRTHGIASKHAELSTDGSSDRSGPCVENSVGQALRPWEFSRWLSRPGPSDGVVNVGQQGLARDGLDINKTRGTKEKPREGARASLSHITPADFL